MSFETRTSMPTRRPQTTFLRAFNRLYVISITKALMYDIQNRASSSIERAAITITTSSSPISTTVQL